LHTFDNVITNNIIINVGEEKLSGVSFSCNSLAIPDTLLVHGAGKSNKKRFYYLVPLLLKLGRVPLLFDFSGHGLSTGKLEHSSLRKRIIESKEISKILDPQKSLSIMASSMGGHVAICLTKAIYINHLILFCPAIYSSLATHLIFNSTFSNEIRKHKSWQSSEAIDIIRNFKGKLLIIWGDNDTVVPFQVVKAIYDNAENAIYKSIHIVPSAPHAIHHYLKDNSVAFRKVSEVISNFFIS
jgi:uncharacterized protein